MQATRPAPVQSAINVTPLVDVVLVLLIIFMVIAPQLQAGPNVELPTTDRPQQRSDDGRQILVALAQDGEVWIDGDQVAANEFQRQMREMAERRSGWRVVIQGDARLSFGAVKRAMLAVEAAGFSDVGLIAEREEPGS